MASKYPKYLLSGVIAEQGEFVIPPDSQEMAGDGRLSIRDGWGTETSTPIEQGGVPPRREDFNGMLYLLSQFALWQQQGGLMNYSSSLDYEVGNEILLNGVKYRALKANGPSSKVVSPGTDTKTWRNLDANVPAGAIMCFDNVTLGGSDGRRPIFWGQSEADEGWVLADGGEGVGGVKVSDLRDRFIYGSNVADVGKTGGSSSVKLSAAMIPAHKHTITIQSNGNHSHTRGTMDIQGELGCDDHAGDLSTGAFYTVKQTQINTSADGGDTSDKWRKFVFQASRNWTGSTSSTGAHSHTADCSEVGGNGSGDTQNVSTLPPFLRKAYFVKLPE